MHEKTLEVNKIIEQNALRNGFRFADPVSLFQGHEFCGTSGSWFFGLTHPGKVHPIAEGHEAMKDAVMERLEKDERSRSSSSRWRP